MCPVKLKSLNPDQHHLLALLTPLPTALSTPVVCVCVCVHVCATVQPTGSVLTEGLPVEKDYCGTSV